MAGVFAGELTAPSQADVQHGIGFVFGALDIPNTGWFAFDNHVGDEKLTLVASEKPLEGVPRRSELKGAEAFQMSPESLGRLAASSLPAMQDAQADDGKPMTATEGTCGLTLSMNDPPPTRLVMNKTTQSGWITAQVLLTHR
jgi:hypothetical protein